MAWPCSQCHARGQSARARKPLDWHCHWCPQIHNLHWWFSAESAWQPGNWYAAMVPQRGLSTGFHDLNPQMLRSTWELELWRVFGKYSHTPFQPRAISSPRPRVGRCYRTLNPPFQGCTETYLGVGRLTYLSFVFINNWCIRDPGYDRIELQP